MKNKKDKSISERILAVKHYMPSEYSLDLNEEDASWLRNAAAGYNDNIVIEERIKTINLLPHLGSEDDVNILAKILRSTDEKPGLRSAAAVNLAHFPEYIKVCEDALLDNFENSNLDVLTRIIKSLGMIGTEKAFKAIDGFKSREHPVIKKQLRFTCALIAFRHNLEYPILDLPKGTDRNNIEFEKNIALKTQFLRPEDIKEYKSRFCGSHYGIKLSQDNALKIEAKDAWWVLFFNEELTKKGMVNELRERNWVMGCMCRFIDETEELQPQYILLSQVNNDLIDIGIFRPNGEILYTGNFKTEDELLSFVITDVERVGTAPALIQGQFSHKASDLKIVLPIERKLKRKPNKLSSNFFIQLDKQ